MQLFFERGSKWVVDFQGVRRRVGVCWVLLGVRLVVVVDFQGVHRRVGVGRLVVLVDGGHIGFLGGFLTAVSSVKR